MANMYAYIREQGDVLMDTVEKRKDILESVVDLFKENHIDRIVAIGSGSSYNAITSSKYFLQKILGIEVKTYFPYSFNHYEQLFGKDILVIGISQTGSSAGTVDALKRAKDEGAHTLALTAYKDAPLTKVADRTLIIACGDENSDFKTKGYTSTVLTFLLMALEIGLAEEKLDKEQYNAYVQELVDISHGYDGLIDRAEEWYRDNRDEFLAIDKATVIGVGPNYGTALEASIKMIETNYFMSSTYELEEYLHGPNMALEEGSYIFYILGKGQYSSRMEKLYEYTKKFTDYSYIIRNNENIGDRRAFSFDFTQYEDFSSLQYVVPFQILCYNRAVDLNHDLSQMRYPSFQFHMNVRK
jgi:glucoselysine-6-phosphate deglycase